MKTKNSELTIYNNFGKGWHTAISSIIKYCSKHNLIVTVIKKSNQCLYVEVMQDEESKITHHIMDHIRNINNLCNATAHICEDCGKYGVYIKANGYNRVLCTNCYTKYCEAIV